MVKFVVAHRRDENNVGDMASNPLQYFLKDSEYQTIDIANVGYESFPGQVPLIVGGGGLISNEFMGDVLERIVPEADKLQLQKLWKLRWDMCDPGNASLHQQFTEEYRLLIKKYIDMIPQTRTPKFLWGAGHNSDVKKEKSGPTSLEYPESILNFDLVGVRDAGTEYRWVPCASCMHPALRKQYTIKNDIIWFEHKKQLLKSTEFGPESIPRFVNSGSNIEQTIELLGSANIILTNSYHGAYWGTLLKKRVVVVGAWSSKFYHLKHRPYMLEKNADFKKMLEKLPTYNSALDECINETNKFWNDIRNTI